MKGLAAVVLTVIVPSLASAGCYVDQSDFASWLCRSGRAYSNWCSAPSRVGSFSSRSECENARRRTGDAAWLNRTRCVCSGSSSSGSSGGYSGGGSYFSPKQYIQMSFASMIAGAIGNMIANSISQSFSSGDSSRSRTVDPEEEAARRAAREREEAELRERIARQLKTMEEGYVDLRRREFEEGKKDLLAKLDQRFGALDGGRGKKSLGDLYCAYQLSIEAAKSGNPEMARKLAGSSFDGAAAGGVSCPEPQFPLPEPTAGFQEEFRREMLETALQEVEVRAREMESLKEKRRVIAGEVAGKKQEVEELRRKREAAPPSQGGGTMDDLLSQAEEALKKSEQEAATAEEEYLKLDREIRTLEQITRNIMAKRKEDLDK